MLFAAEIIEWGQLIREFGALGILGYLFYQLQPLLKMFLDYQSQNSQLDRNARHDANNAYQVSIAEAYKTMRDEGEKNRESQERASEKNNEAQERATDRIVAAVNKSCLWGSTSQLAVKGQ